MTEAPRGASLQVRAGDERYRGGDADAGIETLHAFSFGSHYDPDNLRFGPMVACNEERLAPGAGFAEHPHRDTEIVTWVMAGELTHRDTTTGHETVVRAGDVQRLSAAGGVRHEERNEGPEPLRFLQMWLTPVEFGGEPSYEVVRGIADGTPYAVPRAASMLHIRRLVDGERTAVPDAARVYVHVVRGGAVLGESKLAAGDAARITDARGVEARALGATELLLWELPAEPVYG